MIEPMPKIRIDKSPDVISVVVARIININAADPANLCAIPIQRGRIEFTIQCR